MNQSILPVIKWSGSKRLQSSEIVKHFPDFEKYYEPFIGGGSVLIRTNAKKAICGDICKPLIDFWIEIRDNPKKVTKEYEKRWHKLQDEGYMTYYDIRDKFNKKQNPHDLLFLSRTCVNGLIRFNSKGEFNNSLHHTRSGIVPEKLTELIFEWSQLIQEYKFVHSHYKKTTKNISSNDLVYLDPPYFNTKGRYFGKIDNEEFFAYLKELNEKNVKIVLSYDGTRGTKKYTETLPKKIFKRHLLLNSGHSAFKNVMDKQTDKVKESLWLNF